MKRFITSIVLLILTCLTLVAQNYISKDKTIDGVRTIEAHPSVFEHQTEQYVLSWNYTKSDSRGIEGYYLAILANDQVAPWSITAGDKLQLGLIQQSEYIELVALMDASPEAYETPNGTKYRTMAYYIVPSSEYSKLFKGFDRFKIDVKVRNIAPVTLAVKLPFSAIEHMLMSYLDIMIVTGR